MYYSGNYYLTQSEMEVNAAYIVNYFLPKGWTLNAICGMLGNMRYESTINPGIWQNLNPNNPNLGYGLVQWTPSTNFIDWCNSRGLSITSMDSALMRIEFELENGLQFYPSSTYDMTFREFKVSEENPSLLGDIFLKNYERPEVQNQPHRGENALWWYQYFSGYVPPNPQPTKSKKFKWWLYLRQI